MNSGRPETMENLPALYTIFQGEVAMVTDYGAFVKIPGCRKQGLVHRTHMSSCRVDKPSEIVDVGDKVWVKLIGREMKNDRIKVSLSMKVVNQGTGKDLDPNNVIIEQEERRRRSFQDYTGQKITLEAVLNTTCKKCGCKGEMKLLPFPPFSPPGCTLYWMKEVVQCHFAKDCFTQPGGTKYSLIPDEEEEEEEAKSAEFEKPDPMKNSSRKRKKEKKKKKHRDRKSSDSDSSDSESDIGKRSRHTSKDSKAAKKKKKKKKHKKKHKD
ncbi:nucleolar protein of 40 kDa isoform X1 [Otolemur garnettii]|uniref:nucleolar protein of 40 kDa isoform X1 n=1 Tax=Otolemur garnettii TaxID=30611 RepID=UPI000C7EB934|nr:nucleolar protein of 40 kDa isoform X1 [Otolemur garnettii]